MDEQIQEIFDDQEISETSDVSTSSKESTVWKYFYKWPPYAPGHKCS
ncbi:511_t:CDS:2, partial [Entrophospora sp. SA101]